MLDRVESPSSDADGSSNRSNDYDVIVIGAGLSGICAASHLARSRPNDRILILEAREAIGGTWDLFRYPGVRSDSDMFTLGFGFRPWTDGATLADGPAIRNYVRETATAYDLDRRIAFQHKVRAADWSSDAARWSLAVETPEGERTLTANFVFCCTGYYDYDQGHMPDYPGAETYGGRLVHPQKWPEDLEIEGKRFAVIGSGATAVTLVPALADRGAKHVSMVQRTPTYIMTLPKYDRVVKFLQNTLPAMAAYRLARIKNILRSVYIFQMAKLLPNAVRKTVKKNAIEELGDKANVEVDFNPPYDPWDQRFCVAPDGDFFQAIKRGDADIVTGKIDTFTEGGVRMEDGREVAADVIISATGLKLKVAGGMKMTVDGEERALANTFTYRGAMFSGVPNLGFTFGYTNASWTLKCEMSVKWMVKLLNHMERAGVDIVLPTPPEGMAEREFLNLTSGYIQRSKDILPKQGTDAPWVARQNYFRDYFGFAFGGFAKGLSFGKATVKPGDTAKDAKETVAA
ncbi:MAG: NAD(P)/FAD-dependent oxidoreductase [Pseudomonadota bacterium]